MTSFPEHRVVQGEVDIFAPAYEQRELLQVFGDLHRPRRDEETAVRG